MNTQKKVAVVIPFYQSALSNYERISLMQCQQVLGSHHLVAIKPQGLNFPDELPEIQFSEIISFGDEYFKGLAGYNKLMLSAGFYKRFLDFDYILIYQMDAFVFKDELDYWCSQDYDYVGAPWIRKKYHKSLSGLTALKITELLSRKKYSQDNDVPNKFQFENKIGNGGFSLRRVKKFHDLCVIMKPTIDFYLSNAKNHYNEDVFWSIEVNKEKRILNIPDLATGLRFAFEVPPFKPEKLTIQNLPFGCHDWDHYADFWQPVFKSYGYEI